MIDLGDIRKQYTQGRLDETTAADNAMTQFHAWFEAYRATEPLEPTIMTLATVDEQAQPWQRVVLLKAYDGDGFIFFTNYDSHKGQHLAHTPKASLHFFWIEQERQVHVQGAVEKLDRAAAEAYFHSRPRESQLGAWASQQSRPLADRAELEARFYALSEQFAEQEIPLPDYWGGYRVRPNRIEFWQGGEHRLHDRLEYVREGQGEVWHKQRLNP